MTKDVPPISQDMITLYDRFTHVGGTRRDLIAGLARLAGGTAAALALLPLIEARAEAAPFAAGDIDALLAKLGDAVTAAVAELRTIDPTTLGDYRAVGRAQLPSTVIGCLVHGAEHGMRHVGQLSVTARIVRAGLTS